MERKMMQVTRSRGVHRRSSLHIRFRRSNLNLCRLLLPLTHHPFQRHHKPIIMDPGNSPLHYSRSTPATKSHYVSFASWLYILCTSFTSTRQGIPPTETTPRLHHPRLLPSPLLPPTLILETTTHLKETRRSRTYGSLRSARARLPP
jgi:hypothetical protein